MNPTDQPLVTREDLNSARSPDETQFGLMHQSSLDRGIQVSEMAAPEAYTCRLCSRFFTPN
eukprot:258820-Rhodomonas_salina.5